MIYIQYTYNSHRKVTNDQLVFYQVLLVVINYRVGPLGFFTLGTEEAPGNVGLLDQVEQHVMNLMFISMV